MNGGPDASLTIGGFIDGNVDVRHFSRSGSLRKIVRRRGEIICKGTVGVGGRWPTFRSSFSLNERFGDFAQTEASLESRGAKPVHDYADLKGLRSAI